MSCARNYTMKSEPERPYILQGAGEFERLEHQSSFDFTSPERDLGDISLAPGQRFLDAGCGSGILARYLAQKFPKVTGFGFDMAETTLAAAKKASEHLKNLTYVNDNIISPSTETGPLNLIYSRYVVQHLSPSDQLNCVKSCYQRLAPKGRLRLIDIDGLFYNIWPRTPFLHEALEKLEHLGTVDLRMGRKLPQLLSNGGFQKIEWRVETLGFQGELLELEAEMAATKIESGWQYYQSILGSADAVRRFKEEYLNALKIPGVVVFVNKFIADGVR